ncbi:MAG: RNA polymerase sigma-70 factor (ECF subfamily) [Candidatus Azotimanducaceae bacterium]|jgi:RNA polymerase sigma-70 factor (ECF subfamily)|tara:strand:+ start:6589 stop:7212 length:624 start_codon:yes stop_codon:yes gene_type:complete
MSISIKSKAKMTNPSGPDWNALLVKVGSHQDKAAFGALFSHFGPLLKGFLLKGGGVEPEQAEELVQETMIKVWRKAPSYAPTQAAASTWMYTIARNTRIDWLRKHAKKNHQTDELVAENLFDENEESSPFSALIQSRNASNIKEHLNSLPQEQLQVLTLMYFQGKSGQEVANELEIPLGTVKSRVRLALQKLKLKISPEGEEHGVYA